MVKLSCCLVKSPFAMLKISMFHSFIPFFQAETHHFSSFKCPFFGGKLDPPGLNFQLQQGQVFPGTRRPQVTDISASEVKKHQGRSSNDGFFYE